MRVPVGLRVAWRGTRFRAVSSVLTVVVAVVAVAAATLGPMYSATAQDSLVRRQLADAPVFQTGLAVRADLRDPEGSQSPAGVVAGVRGLIASPRYDTFWGDPAVALATGIEPVTVAAHPTATYQAAVSWRDGMCVSVRIVTGRCPTSTADGPAEAMVSTRTAAAQGVRVGQRLTVGLSSTRPGGNQPLVVGVYDAATAGPPGWVDDSPEQAAPPVRNSGTATLDEVLVSQQTVVAAGVGVQVAAFRPLRVGDIHARQLPELERLSTPTTIGPYTVTSPAPALIDSIAAGRGQVRTAAVAVTVQLVLLALFVLYLVVAAAAEQRAPEVALAKLRGMSTRATAVFTLAEPAVLLVAGLPIGVGLAVLADVLLARGLTGGSEVRFTVGAGLAAVAGLAGGVAAAGLAARRLLGTPVLGQLRRTGGRRAVLARSVAVDTAALVGAAAGVYELRTGNSDLVGLAAPGLIALAVGLILVRLVPPVARLAVTATRRSPRVGAFLAARNTARRPAGTRLVVLLAVAVALAVFGVDGQLVSQTVSTQTAQAAVGAARVVHVTAPSPGRLLEAVRAADPGGRSAMAVVQDTGNTGVPLLAVDAQRLTSTTVWEPTWAGTTPAALSAALHPDGFALPGAQGRITATWTNDATRPTGTLIVSVDLQAPDGTRHRADGPTLAAGRHGTLDIALPAPCDTAPCALLGWDFARDLTTASTRGTFATITLTGLSDTRGPLTAPPAPDGGPRWRYARQPLDVLDASRGPDAGISGTAGDGMTVYLNATSLYGFTVVPAAVPAAVPVLLGRTASATPYDARFAATGQPVTFTGQDLSGVPVVVAAVPGSGAGTLPRVGTGGALVDLAVLTAEHPGGGSQTDPQVWFSPTADVAAILARLAPDGVAPVTDTTYTTGPTVQTSAGQAAQLTAGGPAVGLRLYVAAALAAVVLALGALLTAALVAARRRSYEIAAVLALGARRSALVGAGVTEQLLLVALGTVTGVAVGAATARLALPNLGAVTAGGPVTPDLVVWSAVLAVGTVVLLVAAALIWASSHRTVTHASPDRLREVQA